MLSKCHNQAYVRQTPLAKRFLAIPKKFEEYSRSMSESQLRPRPLVFGYFSNRKFLFPDSETSTSTSILIQIEFARPHYPKRIRIHSSAQDFSANIGNRLCVVKRAKFASCPPSVMILDFIAKIRTALGQKSKKNATSKVDSFMWTDDEAELLFKVTLEKKTSKATDNVDC